VDLARCYSILSGVAAARDLEPLGALADDETEAVLDLARVAAHAVERIAAPLVCFSLGRALADLGPAKRLEVLRAAIAAIETEPGASSPKA
jgi:hypothetical protein